MSTGYKSTGYKSTGDRSTGDRSTGDRSTGDRSTGDASTGDRSTGYKSTGDRSTGDRSTGHNSTGYRSTGNWSTGARSTGDRSTGNWSISNYSTGHFSTIDYSGFGAFNKPCTVEDWKTAEIPSCLFFDITQWIYNQQITDIEKKNNPTYKTTGGYLKVTDYKEAFTKSLENASDEEIEMIKKLPNFDANIFLEISGYDIRKRNKIKVECNGKTVYISRDKADELGLV